MGANFFESVGPKSEIIGILESANICIIPLSIVIAKSNLFPKQVTKAGQEMLVSCSGNIANGIELLILSLSS